MEVSKLIEVQKKGKKRRPIIHRVQDIHVSHCSNCLIQVGPNFAKKKKYTTTQFHVENFTVSNCPRSLIQVGSFLSNRFIFGGTDNFTANTTGADNFTENTAAKSLPMSRWNKEQVRCWLMNITLPKYLVTQMYNDGVTGFKLQMYKKSHFKKDFLLSKSDLRLLVHLRKSWLKMEIPENNSYYDSENIVVCSPFSHGMVNSVNNIQDVLLHLKSNLKSFRDSFTTLDISDLNYSDRSDILVGSNILLDSFFIEISNIGKNNIMVGFINLPSEQFSDTFIEELNKILRKVKDTGLDSFILGDFNLNSNSRKLHIYEKNTISALTDNLFFRLRTKSAFIRNSISNYAVVTNSTGVFNSGEEL